MNKKNISRRKFVKRTAAATVTLAVIPNFGCKGPYSAFDAKGLPTRILGNTGCRIPLMAVGAGSRFCSVKDEDMALEILEYALDSGLYYWDTAHDYGNENVISEKRLGKILKHRRKEVFLATKVGSREPDEGRRHIEESLNRLQTDYLDILQIHSIESVEDVNNIGRKGGILDVVRQMRTEGVTKYIGFTGHSSAEAMALAARQYDFDTMLIALNHYNEGEENFEKMAVPVAAQKGLGIMVIKVIRPRETVKSITPKELIQYALSLKNVHAAVIGIDSIEVLKENIALIKDFKMLDSDKMDNIRISLNPFYRHEGVEWMQPHYRDGFWA